MELGRVGVQFAEEKPDGWNHKELDTAMLLMITNQGFPGPGTAHPDWRSPRLSRTTPDSVPHTSSEFERNTS